MLNVGIDPLTLAAADGYIRLYAFVRTQHTPSSTGHLMCRLTVPSGRGYGIGTPSWRTPL